MPHATPSTADVVSETGLAEVESATPLAIPGTTVFGTSQLETAGVTLSPLSEQQQPAPFADVCELSSPTDALAEECFLSSSFSSEGSVPQSPMPSRACPPRCCDVQLADGSAFAKHKQQCHPELDDSETLASPVGPLPPLELVNWNALAITQNVPLDTNEIGKKNLSADITHALSEQRVLARNLVLARRPNDLCRSVLPVNFNQSASAVAMSEEFASEVGIADPQRRRSAPSIMSSPSSTVTQTDVNVNATPPAMIDPATSHDTGVVPANGDGDVSAAVPMYELPGNISNQLSFIPQGNAYLDVFGTVHDSFVFSGEMLPVSVALSDVHVRPGARSASKRSVSTSTPSGHVGAHRRSVTAAIPASTVPILASNTQGMSSVQQQAGRGTKRSQSMHEGAKNSAPKRRAVQTPIRANTFQAILPGIAPIGSAAPIAGMAQIVAVPTTAPEPVDKPFKCDIPGCTKTYKNASGLKYHLSHGHTDPNGDDGADRPYRCGINACPKTYKNANGLKYHLDHHHPGYTVAQVVAAGANGQMNASQQGLTGLQNGSNMGQTSSNANIAARRRSTGTKNPRSASRRRSTTSGTSSNQPRQRTQDLTQRVIAGSNDSYQNLAAANVAGTAPITISSATDANAGSFAQILQLLQDETSFQLYNSMIQYGSGSQQAEANAQVAVLGPVHPAQDNRHNIQTVSHDANSISNVSNTNTNANPTTAITTTTAAHVSSPCKTEPQ